MPALRMLIVLLAAASVAGLVPTTAFGSSPYIETASYTWVQPPVWTGLVPAAQAGLPAQTVAPTPTQPPASVLPGPVPPYRASTGYVWMQPWGGVPATAPTPTQP